MWSMSGDPVFSLSRTFRALLVALTFFGQTSWAGDSPGRFDYYVLSLSWSPEYCASEARPADTQCARPYAFVVHGLWPQNERGWPENCGRGEYLEESLIQSLLPLMPSRGLILHEWRKHGVCSGLGAKEYFATTRRARERITVPARYEALDRPLVTSVARIEQDFLAANPGLAPNRIAVQCKGRFLRELRICMTRDLESRACGVEVRDRCGAEVILRPTRS